MQASMRERPRPTEVAPCERRGAALIEMNVHDTRTAPANVRRNDRVGVRQWSDWVALLVKQVSMAVKVLFGGSGVILSDIPESTLHLIFLCSSWEGVVPSFSQGRRRRVDSTATRCTLPVAIANHGLQNRQSRHLGIVRRI